MAQQPSLLFVSGTKELMRFAGVFETFILLEMAGSDTSRSMMRDLISIFCVIALFVLSSSVEAGWYEERQLGPYLIRSEFALKDVAELVSDLGDLQSDLETQLGVKCEPQEIQIHLFRNRFSYNDYLRKRVPDGTKRQALFVQGTDAGRVYAYRQREVETDVRHETTHALLHSALPYVPLWLDEGIAEYYEVPPQMREKHNPHLRDIRFAMRLGWRPAIEKLEAKRQMLDMDAKDYRDAFSVVHYILHGPDEAREALAVYLEEIQSGAVPTPLSRQLRSRIPDLDRKMIEHFK